MNRCVLVGVSTSKTRSVRIRRGRSRWTDQFNAGSASIVIDNRDGSYDPFTGNNIDDEIKVRYSDGVNTADVFVGRVLSQSADFSLDRDATSTLQVIDDLALCARFSVPSSYAGTQPSELSGDRMDTFAFAAGLLFVGLSFSNDAGNETLAATTYNTGDNFLDMLRQVTDTEQGRLFATRANVIRFQQRNTGTATTTATFSDDPLIAGIPYQGVAVDTATDVVANVVNITNVGGTLQQAVNSTSQSAIGPFEYSLSDTLYTSDARALQMANYLANLWGTPYGRISQLSIALHSLSDADAFALSKVELGDAVRVVFTPVGGSQQDRTVFVEGIQHDIGFDAWQVTLSLSEPAFEPFTLDSAANGVLNTDRLGI